MSEKTNLRLSVIIPAYNEEKRIGESLDKLEAYLAGAGYAAEIIVVDDGSADGTAGIVREKAAASSRIRLLSNPGNRGKGCAVRNGMLDATGQVRLFFDADGSTPIDQVEKFWPLFEKGAAVCIGSRAHPAADIVVHQPWYRETMGRTFNLMVRLVALRGFTDTQCGFKAFTAEAAEIIFRRQRLNRFGFDVELLYIARLYGLSIAEAPVQWINSPASRVNPISDASRMFLELLQIRLNALRGLYRKPLP